MKLRPKLILFALIAISVPIISMAFFSGIFVYRDTLISEQRLLEEVAREVRNEVEQIRHRYYSSLKEFASEEYLKSKLYVYSKYWGQIDSTTLEMDIIPLKNEIEKYALANRLESVAVYRKGYDKFIKVAIVGRSRYIPDVIYFESIRKFYDQVYFYVYSDGLYLNAVAPVFASGKETGLLLLQKSFDQQYFSMLSLQYGVSFALFSKGRFIFTGLPGIQNYSFRAPASETSLEHDSYRHGNQDYNLVLYDFDLGNSVTGTLFIGSPKNTFFRQNQLNLKLLLIALSCVFITVLTFYLWGINLIRAVRKLLTATGAVSAGDYDYRLDVARRDEFGSLAGAFNDMTRALKENNERLQKSNWELMLLNSYIDAVFQSLLVTTLVIDREYNIVLANQSAQSELELPRDYTSVSMFSLPIFSRHKPEIVSKIEEIFEGGEPTHISKFEVGEKVYSVDFFPVADSEENVSGIVLVLIDLTESLTMERTMVKYEKLAEVGKLAAGIAHEIGNPMGVILNHVQLIATGRLSEEEERKYIGRIESEIKRINTLVNRLLHFSRDESLEMRPVSLAELSRELLDLFSPKLNRKNIRAFIENRADGAEILGNPDSLKQVLFNLLNNAIQSIEHQYGNIRISIEEEEGKVRMLLEDNGKGMEKAILDKLFDPFITDKAKNSTGLGLYMSSKIVKKHRGSISVASELRRGTVVTLRFPKGG